MQPTDGERERKEENKKFFFCVSSNEEIITVVRNQSEGVLTNAFYGVDEKDTWIDKIKSLIKLFAWFTLVCIVYLLFNYSKVKKILLLLKIKWHIKINHKLGQFSELSLSIGL